MPLGRQDAEVMLYLLSLDMRSTVGDNIEICSRISWLTSCQISLCTDEAVTAELVSPRALESGVICLLRQVAGEACAIDTYAHVLTVGASCCNTLGPSLRL